MVRVRRSHTKCDLTIRSSRARFAASCKCYIFSPAQGRKAARLNSGVRQQTHLKLSNTRAKSRLTPSAIAFFASLTTLAKILVVNVLFRDPPVDWPHVLFVLTRVSAFSLGAGLLAFALAPVLQRNLAALLFGLTFAFIGAAAYVMSAA